MPPPMKLAIVGGGPSGFYVASRLLSLIPPTDARGAQLRVHVFDRLWAPHGLVRYGVAPDHPENCTHKFDAAASDPRLKFFGNVNVGGASKSVPHAMPISLSALFENYTHLVFSTGCTEPTIHPALPLSEHCMPALDFVHWYTRHPSRTAHAKPPPPLEKLSRVALIGNGNVSLDVARMLLTPVSVLSKYDVPQSVLDVLSQSNVKHVDIIARRGPLHAAFTTKELRELMNLPDSYMTPIKPSLLETPPSIKATRQQSRILQLLQKGSVNQPGSVPKSWSLHFFQSPTGLTPPSSMDPSALAQLALEHTEPDPANPNRIRPTGQTSTLPTSLVITSLGSHASPSEPFYDPALGHIRTTARGHVLVPSTFSAKQLVSAEERSSIPPPIPDRPIKNVYASGWAATGAKGVLASTMMNAYALADTILSDWLGSSLGWGQAVETTVPEAGEDTTAKGGNVGSATQGEVHSSLDLADRTEVVVLTNPQPADMDAAPAEILEGLKDGKVVEYKDWKKIDEEEVRRSESGKERERMDWTEASQFLGL